ncbi:ATP-dependent RNA helicase DDX19A [Trichonephila inaurata madagascariensis]|uniref:ATP-dependent RNA helicase DDX19A n=1 Tax=Trichonephila inaurata madagascariensis TaxID=2747483 RepID=A0A8X7CJJ6_9ARAC|nr:ATP-dependent RNA helicase DDX19A [Trichonephila inaurata madagascariensis]
MSRWDKYCRSGTFNKNFGSNKISGERSSRNETFVLRKPETSAQSSISTFDTDNYAVEETDFCNEVSFSDVQFHVKLLKAINEAGFYHPRKAQKEILSSLFEWLYRCYVICAPDKSGKTSAILLWILNELLRDETKEYPKALMVCPTHEIAESTYLFAEKIAKFCEVKVCLVKKGTHFNKFDKMTDLIISTPDKLLNLAETSVSIQNVKIFILNEAHCMSSSPDKILYDFINNLSLQYKKIEIESSMKKYPFKEVFVTYSSVEEKVNALRCLEDFKHCQVALALSMCIPRLCAAGIILF